MSREITPESQQIGLRLKALRVESAREVDEIARELGISAPSWYSYENGRTKFPYTMIPDVARALRVSVHHLSERLFQPYRQQEPSRSFESEHAGYSAVTGVLQIAQPVM